MGNDRNELLIVLMHFGDGTLTVRPMASEDFGPPVQRLHKPPIFRYKLADVLDLMVCDSG